jgi:uncharacterized membrane protein YphA (DoxX/SURF4 family)
MNTFTRIFLVLLRLAIGWLFLFEGIEKVQSVQLGPTASNKPWTSAGYLAQSSGPASSFFHWQAGGDADEKALERLTVPAEGVSPALKQDWEDYLQRFADHYRLDDDQRAKARQKLDESLVKAREWLTDTTHRKELDKDTSFPGAAFTPRKTPVQRITEYRAKVEEYRRDQEQALPAFGEDVYQARLRTKKADAAKLRQGLLDDLDAPLRKSLEEVLTPEQKKEEPVTAAVPPVLRWTDRLVSYGLVVIGACLLLGLLTRLNCFAGALFLIALYLAIPAFPWSPENIKAEGHYLFVNKNLITALALLALATTRSGMWFGLDGVVQYLNPFRSRAPASRPRAAAA